ncbi:MAG: glutamine--fructose-6-phosphate aminotransferase [Candidatus Edwardsbacteria bacterium RIFOXYD12_FULL_50_11]|uniref:Glutamine--fructose-6-phosphate aminotransferase [isomerizing] n=1 Tax=Candidatus Edwardsbacteria bacterium GWF2_54_11 TaxID=1817851 RepID=A0A1F5REK1_9BACT|nr:MAG: glutamine--fructose-6-phosphate aminotransferase [Candidatus Edwardsbacteria bacterium RifOxyC12_full_54_24]OGF06541.1 MAG: glutamine--fructose-6-phosphate aminotransferase [Candidatus Edwardsbacteria bacterium RifOxyA12_full_54_48]OGF12761.1 MAG: glutamine--fructose-6-phosphate aminotransferase [Candidatus Edwardsbacteria bacterium GWE2_54_12]OGF12822.1 MAG: glutamine--fructose-6-phosphate aminotransferase [Candidatus Edwardsbacteria bacterium GWF2_54_11]OGF17859.1 MAG: glutamine--fruc
MCGIVGYIGTKNCVPLIMEGLKRLEYRGYDSAGLALIKEGKLIIEKKAGKVADLAEMIKGKELSASLGIGHTRWATHGEPDDLNAHPHWDCKGEIAIIHNGIIENYSTLKKKLIQDGHQIRTATDTEILVHLIEEMYKQTRDLFSAVRYALLEVEGTFGILVISPKEPDRIIAARRGSPLVIGVGEGENLIASDAAALVEHTRQVVYLNDDEMACIMADSFYTKTIYDQEVVKQIEKITFSLEQIERGGYEHFMLKEINEQPTSLENAMRGRLMAKEGDVRLGGLHTVMDKLLNARRIIITSCGTSWHAALVGKYMLEQLGRIPVDVDYASEFRFRNPVIRPDDVVMVISQSGETADTLAALREAKSRGVPVLGIVNVVGSTIARETDAGVYIHAGPEIGVASTKAFTSQIAVLGQIAILLAKNRGLPQKTLANIAQDLADIPNKVRQVLLLDDQIKKIAQEFKNAENFLYLGRGSNFPTALEGALKLKEISYIHAEGYPAAEMKHGPIALIDENMPVVFIVPKDALYDKVVSNIQEVRARKGRVIAIANVDDNDIDHLAEFVIKVPRTYSYFGPIINSIPLQLLAYHIALLRGCNVDQPRNLAKSVTVE